MRFLARLVGGIASLIVDMRRQRCPGHVASPMTSPPYCQRCWEPMP